MSNLRDIAMSVKAWPFEEARRVLKRYEQNPRKGYVLFETGYGPSGLPHIGTFGEVVRTTMAMRAFRLITIFQQNSFVFPMILTMRKFRAMCRMQKVFRAFAKAAYICARSIRQIRKLWSSQ